MAGGAGDAGRGPRALYDAGDPSAAAVAIELARLTLWSAEDKRAHELCVDALARLPDGPTPERVQLLAIDALAVAKLDDAAFGAALRGVTEARSMAMALNDDGLVGFTYSAEFYMRWDVGRIALAIGTADDALRRLTSATWVQSRVDVAGSRAQTLFEAGRFTEVDEVVGDILRVAEEVGNTGAILSSRLARDVAYLHRSGELTGSEARMHEGVAATSGAAPFNSIFLIWAATLQAERGDPEGALVTAIRARQGFRTNLVGSGTFAGCELWCLALLDHSDWALRLEEYEHFVPVAGTPSFHGRHWFALFLVLSHVTRGELAAAAALYPVLREVLDDGWRVGPLQPVEGLVGLAAAAGGNWDVAEEHFRSALAFVDEVGDRLGKPAVQKWYAWMLLRRAAPGDRDHARVLLDDAIASFRSMGMQLSLGEAEAMRGSLDG